MAARNQVWGIVVLCAMAPLLQAGSCNAPDPKGDGTLQLFYDVNVDAAASMGLSDLASIQVVASGLSGLVNGTWVSLDSSGGTTLLAAQDRLIPGPTYAVAPGFLAGMRIENPVVTFKFKDNSVVTTRVPSGPQTGWKILVDTTTNPSGYPIVAGQVTGVRLFMNLKDLFHKTGPGQKKGDSNTWQARPTIDSAQYNILASGGYDPDIIVVVFDPQASDSVIQNAITAGGYTIVNMYPGVPKLYKLQLPSGGNLQSAHMYFRARSDVLAAAPDVTPKYGPSITPFLTNKLHSRISPTLPSTSATSTLLAQGDKVDSSTWSS